jgi:selenocysteine lyase/cysteine desulfurase
MTGTQNHEGIAGTVAAIEHIASLAPDGADPRERIVRAFDAIREYEERLLSRLLDGLAGLPDVRVWGIVDRKRFAERVPTLSITHSRVAPREIARHLAERGIFVWDGNYYALALSETLGLEPEGTVRIGILHYNTDVEVDRLLEALEEL